MARMEIPQFCLKGRPSQIQVSLDRPQHMAPSEQMLIWTSTERKLDKRIASKELEQTDSREEMSRTKPSLMCLVQMPIMKLRKAVLLNPWICSVRTSKTRRGFSMLRTVQKTVMLLTTMRVRISLKRYSKRIFRTQRTCLQTKSLFKTLQRGVERGGTNGLIEKERVKGVIGWGWPRTSLKWEPSQVCHMG